MAEMRGVVDEPAELDYFAPQEAKKSTFDWDRVCAYKTFKIVRIRDR
jgi:hypothetical protein